MKAAHTFNGHHLPKKQFRERTLRQCAKSGKEKNIVLIEVDSDDFGDVIILDVPESFQEKFRKNKEPRVINVDVDDGDGSNNRSGENDMAGDATTSNRFSSASPVRSSKCPNVVEGDLFVGEESKPVKLSKSKRTYSGTGISRNGYGLNFGSESDDSDCELMENSFGKLREQWEKASFRRRHDASCGYCDSEDKDDPPASNSEETTDEHSEHTNSENTSNHESDDVMFAELFNANDTAELFTRNRGHHYGSSDLENDPGTGDSDQPVNHKTEPSTTGNSDLPYYNFFFKCSSISDGGNNVSNDFAERLAERSKISQQDNEAGEANNVFAGCHSYDVTKELTNRDVENDLATINDIITDRQKIKQTDVYKRALEEELVSRQQQLQLQAEEARRLRDRKRAKNMQIMDNEQRQRQRLEEVRETRRKDEENLNLKDEVRAEIKTELRRLETTCFDMASLLRALGIHVNGGIHPSSNEVQAAYKRACLRFHPDRLPTTDLRLQVEAEEKFKLISNMKDKFCQSR